MKQTIQFSLIALALLFTNATQARNVLSAADELAEGIEHLDTELHRINAHGHVIEVVHHAENTVFEFVDLLISRAPRQLVMAEFNHISTDMRDIRQEMRAHRYYGSRTVMVEFLHAWTAYRYLDHSLPRHFGGGQGHGGGIGHGGGSGHGPVVQPRPRPGAGRIIGSILSHL